MKGVEKDLVWGTYKVTVTKTKLMMHVHTNLSINGKQQSMNKPHKNSAYERTDIMKQ